MVDCIYVCMYIETMVIHMYVVQQTFFSSENNMRRQASDALGTSLPLSVFNKYNKPKPNAIL
jgi:hypothetical protein